MLLLRSYFLESFLFNKADSLLQLWSLLKKHCYLNIWTIFKYAMIFNKSIKLFPQTFQRFNLKWNTILFFYLFDGIFAEPAKSCVEPEVFPARKERVEGVELRAVADVPSGVGQLGLDVEPAHCGGTWCGLGVTYWNEMIHKLEVMYIQWKPINMDRMITISEWITHQKVIWGWTNWKNLIPLTEW